MSPSPTTSPVRRRELLALAGAGILAGCSTPLDSGRVEQGARWPMYGYDAGRTSYQPGTAGPTASVAVDWKTQISADATASPVVVGRTLYVGGRDGGLRALAVADGTERWSLDFDGESNVTPATDGGTVFVGTTGDQLHAVDASGGTTIFGTRFGLHRWATDLTSSVLSPPAVVDGTVYAATVDGTLRAIDTGDGSVEWTYAGGGKQLSAPAVGPERVYFNRPAVRERLVALAVEDGTEVWSFAHGSETDVAVSTPAVDDGQVLLGSREGRAYAIDAATGDAEWTAGTAGPVVGSPVVADETAFVATRDGTVHAIDRRSGDRRWTVGSDHGIRASPAVAGETLYVATTAGRIRALDVHDGTARWQFDLDEEIVGSVVPLASRLYVRTAGGTLYALAGSSKKA